jgi:ABC-type transporter MlaC component
MLRISIALMTKASTACLAYARSATLTRLIRPTTAPVKSNSTTSCDRDPGWQVVDVLTDGTISRVAVQRSDFQQMMQSAAAAR